MDYLSQIPRELFHLIGSRLPVDAVIILYSMEEYTKELTSDTFWYTYFNEREIPIINKGNDFVTWLNEYVHSKESYTMAKYVLNRSSKKYYTIANIHPISILSKYNIKYEMVMLKRNREYGSDVIIFNLDGKKNLILRETNEDYGIEIVELSKDPAEIFGVLFKLIYYKNIED